MSNTTTNITIQTAACILLASVAMAQSIKTKRGAVCLYGCESNCSQPATIDYKKVQHSTPEWRTIKSDGVKKGSARYDLLISRMNDHIKTAVSDVAQKESRDCVVRRGDITDAKGLTVVDLTAAVVAHMRNHQSANTAPHLPSSIPFGMSNFGFPR